MSIPDYQTLMRPLLETLSDGKELRLKELVDQLSRKFSLSEEEMKTLLPSGQQTVFQNRVGWAKTYLKNAGLVESTGRGITKITSPGIDFLRTHQGPVNAKNLEKFQQFQDFRSRSSRTVVEKDECNLSSVPNLTPMEQIESAFNETLQTTQVELLDRLRRCSPLFFEHVVVELLLKMGYGGITGKGQVTQFSNDGGLDGIINQDKLGLDVVCIQAKRWESTVGRPVVQGFVGSMDYVRAKKGVIITTSRFSRDAEDYVQRVEGKKVVLIDGDELTKLMIDHNLGVTVKKTYEIKEISNDYFEED